MLKKNKTYNDISTIIIDKINSIPIISNKGRKNILDIKDYVDYILFVLITGCSWNDLNLIPNFKIHCDTIRKKFNKWVLLGIFDNIFNELLNDYISNNNIEHLYLDSYDCINLSGNKSTVALGHKYKSKNVSKISLLVDKNKIPFAVDICKGNIHDNKRIPFICNNLNINKSYNKPILICADKGYIINKKLNKYYRKIYNISIVTDKKKQMKKSITIKNKTLLNNRIIIEHFNSIIRRKFKHLTRISDKNENLVKRWFILSFIYLIIEYKNKN